MDSQFVSCLTVHRLMFCIVVFPMLLAGSISRVGSPTFLATISRSIYHIMGRLQLRPMVLDILI